MNTQQPDIQYILEPIFSSGITLSLEGDNLKIKKPRGKVTSADVEQIKAHKPEIIAYVRRRDEGLRLLQELHEDSVWKQRGNVLYQDEYMVKADYRALIARLLSSGNESDHRQAMSELVRQQTELPALKVRTSVKPARAVATRDAFWQLLARVRDWFQDKPPIHGVVFWYGPGTGYPNELVTPDVYMAYARNCLESGEPSRVHAAMTAMQRTLGIEEE
ncbi:MAG: hypothetical protein E6J34_11515 [Chloroflexi bacterium]|nr:MAG: hypothetical protein E6J34_11515 [Chloroflexota bacterium]